MERIGPPFACAVRADCSHTHFLGFRNSCGTLRLTLVDIMSKGTIRIRRVYNNKLSPKIQRCVMIEPWGWTFRKDDENAEAECMIGLLSQIEIAEVRLGPSPWVKERSFLKRDGWREDGRGGWIVRPFVDYQCLMGAMREAQNEGESFELQILTIDAKTIIAEINDNDEHWYLLGPIKLLNDEWLMKCEASIPDWRFKWRRNK